MLLNQIGLEFSVVVPDVDEAPVVNGGASGSIESQVIRLAEAKVQAVIPKLPAAGPTRRLVIGADTIVLVDGQVLGKPVSHQDAVDMLRLLAGRTHEVYTGVTVLDLESGQVMSGAERTAVTFADLAEPVIQRYVATGEPMDKAGAYAVQGLGSVFIARIEGCYFNVVGLPLSLLGRLLKAHGYDVVDAW
jgi:septum formation protein